MSNKKGFTMIELLVTVLLIGILAAMAMPQYMKVVEKQKGTEAVNILAVIGKAEERYFAVNEKYTTDFSDLDSDLVDFNSRAAANGDTYNTKYFFFVLDGTDDKVSKVKATRRGNEYILQRNYTTGKVCCLNDNTEDADICDVLDLPTDNCDATTGETPLHVCSGSQPVSTAPCSSGCGTQSRSVSCENGVWVTGPWTGTCTSPTQTLPTSQTCGTNGIQTRTCSASCSGGACGAWGTCTTTTCTGTKPSETQTCSTGCGTQTRSVACTNGSWIVGSWTGTCTSPTQTLPTSQSCGNGGTQTRTCTPSCSGGTCGVWSACGCPAGSTYNSDVSRCCTAEENVLDTRDGGCCVEFSGCGVVEGGQTGACRCLHTGVTPIPCVGSSSQACGNCNTGTQTRVCDTTTGQWGTWGTCSGGGTCASGKVQACGDNGTKTCSSSCAWGACQDCNNYEYKVNHKSVCCQLVSLEEDDGTCYTRTWSQYGGQAIGYGGCWAPEGSTQSCMADSSKKYECIENTDQYIPCNTDGDICACMGCGNYGQTPFINTINYKCSITKNGW